MYTYADLLNTQRAGNAIGRLPKEQHEPFFQKVQKVFVRLAEDQKITLDSEPDKLKERTEAFRNLSPDTPLSPQASTLLQEANRVTDELLGTVS